MHIIYYLKAILLVLIQSHSDLFIMIQLDLFLEVKKKLKVIMK